MGFLKRNILFVDDDTATRMLLQAMLKQAGYLPLTAPDAFEALDLVHIHAFDLILLDIMMPKMSGFEFLKRMKSSEKTKDIPVMMLSSKDDSKSIQKALQMGAVDYIVKPPQKDIVCKKIENILGGRPRFAEVSFNKNDSSANVEIIYDAKIKSLGESGMIVESPLAITDLSRQKLRLPLLNEIGVEDPNLEIVQCVEENGLYMIYFSFIKMQDQNIQKIRDWVVTTALKG